MNSQTPKSTQSTELPLALKMHWVTSAIRRFLVTLAEGAVFSTRDLLSLGSRTAVDSALSRMVAAEHIVRLTSGLFMKVKRSDPDWRPSIQTIAEAKLLAFRRIGVATTNAQTDAITQSSKSNAQSKACGDGTISVSQTNLQTVVYETTGNRSKFRLFNGIVVQVKSIANRKLDLAQSVVGTKLKNIWQSVEQLCEDSARAFLRSLGREERADVKVLLPLLPQNISDLLGAPWSHRADVFPILSVRDDRPQGEWFSLCAISHSRALRTQKRPPPLLELNF